MSTLQQDAAHGVINNRIKESEFEATLQRIELPNMPPSRGPRPIPVKQALDEGWKPRRGHYSDLFSRPGKTHFDFSPKMHGDYVRAALIREAKAGREGGSSKSRRAKVWRLTPKQIEQEIERWFASNASDLARAKAWVQGGMKGRFKPVTKTWVLPQSCLHPAARRKVFRHYHTMY